MGAYGAKTDGGLVTRTFASIFRIVSAVRFKPGESFYADGIRVNEGTVTARVFTRYTDIGLESPTLAI
jgi:hypothetical protein